MNTISSLRWYGLAKYSLATERYVKSVEDHEAVRLRFRMRSGSAGLLQEKKRCGLSGNDIIMSVM